MDAPSRKHVVRFLLRVHRTRLYALLFFVFATSAIPCANAGSFKSACESIQSKQLRRHVEVLASDTFEGREAGSRGGRAAGAYLVNLLKRLNVRPAGSENSYYQEFSNGYRNILAVLPGRHPRLKDEFVVVCAHYDHVGYGTRRNSLGPIGYIHNGADDNASGTAGLLEIIAAFSKLEPKPKRSMLFAFWDAEEKGLLGSENWLRNPTVPLKRISLVINIDMIGRLRKNRVTIVGSRSATGWRRFLCERNCDARLQLDFPWTLKRDSDHYPFIENRIPAVMIHTGKHADYHRPSDDADKINYPGLQRIARFVFRVATAAATSENRPRYRDAWRHEDDGDRRQLTAVLPELPARLGISWNLEPQHNGPLGIAGVTPDSPADNAGLRPGDRIVRFGEYRIAGTKEFRGIVMAAKNVVTIRLRREGVREPMTVRVTLNGRPRRVGISWEDDDAEPGSMILRRVIRGSPADRAGLRIGDRITAVAGRSFRSSDEFRRLLTVKKPSLQLTVERTGIPRTVTLRFPSRGIQTKRDTPRLPVRAAKPRSHPKNS